MSVFNYLPDPFPFEIKVDDLPVKFVLKAQNTETWVAIVLLVMWCAGAVFLSWLLLEPYNLVYGFTFTNGLGVLLIIAALVFFGKKIKREIFRLRTKVYVTLSENEVKVTCDANPIRSFTCPLSDYQGIVKQAYGSHLVDGGKTQVVALVMRHRDDNKSIPLIITEARRLGRRRIDRFSQALGLEVLAYDHAVGLGADLPTGTIYANAYQSLKIKIIFSVLALAGLALIVTAGFIFQSWGLSPADGGVLKPLSDRLMFSGVLLILAIGILWGCYVYTGFYLISIQRIGRDLHLKTLRGSKYVFSASDVSMLARKSGTTFTGKNWIETPYAWLTFKGTARKFMIDWQAEFVDELALKELVS